jgi:hypothetical protein
MNVTAPPLSPLASVRIIVARPLVRIKLLFLVASFVSLLLSVSLWFTGHESQGLFVGVWVPSILSLGALLLAGESADAR